MGGIPALAVFLISILEKDLALAAQPLLRISPGYFHGNRREETYVKEGSRASSQGSRTSRTRGTTPQGSR
jgi:hypothetical protein